jgi:hypothetical protein
VRDQAVDGIRHSVALIVGHGCMVPNGSRVDDQCSFIASCCVAVFPRLFQAAGGRMERA